MSPINTFAAALLSVLVLAGSVALRAEDNPHMITLKPMSGPGASSATHRFLLNEIIGKKQAISYFLNENGLCKVTVMVGDVFNGDVANSAAVRFQIALEVGASARMDAGEGISLEFGCQERAQVLTVSTGKRLQPYPSGT